MKTRITKASLRVSYPDTAEAVRISAEDGFPSHATSSMAELMELAASRLMKTRLRPGESSIGVELNVTHAEPATVGGARRAVATCDGVSGRLHRFTINVFDESGLIGSAEHTRAVDRTAGAGAGGL